MSTNRVSPDVAMLTELNNKSFEAEEDGSRENLDSLLTDDFRIVRSNFNVSDKQAMLTDVSANANKGRGVDEVSVKVYGDSAVVTSHLTTRNQNTVSQFWNTKVFVKQGGEWRCRAWQVARLA
jgi:hypothetical protein